MKLILKMILVIDLVCGTISAILWAGGMFYTGESAPVAMVMRGLNLLTATVAAGFLYLGEKDD